MSMRAAATKYGISEATVRERLKNVKTERIEDVAVRLAEAERDIKALPPVDRIRVRSLAERLADLSHTMSEVAELGMRNALKLSQMKARAIDNLSPGDSEGLKEVYMLAETANKSGKMAVDLMTVGKQSLVDAEKAKDKDKDVMAMAPISIPALKKS
jgi:DNA-binding Lrp family transcriptional regulator